MSCPIKNPLSACEELGCSGLVAVPEPDDLPKKYLAQIRLVLSSVAERLAARIVPAWSVFFRGGMVLTLLLASAPFTNTSKADTADELSIYLPLVTISPDCIPTITGQVSDNPAIEQGMLDVINAKRAGLNLHQLTPNDALIQAARFHSHDMAETGVMSHEGSAGDHSWNRAKGVCYNYVAIGEIIAAGYDSPEEVVEAWMKSPGHHKIIVNRDYLEFGGGYAENPDSRYGSYLTVLFGSTEANSDIFGDGLNGPAELPYSCQWASGDEESWMMVNYRSSTPCDEQGE